MVRPRSRFPTDQELRILKIFWQRGPLTVREVREALASQSRELAHTTVVTTLHKMAAKGLLRSEQEGKVYRFSSQVEQRDVTQGMLGDLLEKLFDGSAESLLLNLLESEHVSDQEHQQLRRLINKRRKDHDA